MLRGIRGLRCSRSISIAPRDKSIICRYFSSEDPLSRPTYDPDAYRPSVNRSRVVEEKKAFNFSDIKFAEVFDASRVRNVHDVKEGGYVEISQKDIDKYLPEGLSGEMQEEFDFSER